jgi:hypothetical protein
MIDEILAYENGEMDREQTVAFFQRLIDDGIIQHLQGSYGRFARKLIKMGECTP